MSKKKIIAGIMGSATLITGDGSVSTLASISETEEMLKTEKRNNQNKKQDKSKIRIKRENLNKNNLNLNSFVEKIYNNDKYFWELSLVLSKEKLLNIIELFVQNNESKFIIETKKIITEIKNNSINLSAKDFDDNAIGAFAHTIFKNFSKYCDLYLNLGINQKIMINLYIEKNYFIKDEKKLFQVIGDKTEWEKNETIFFRIKPYSIKNYPKGLNDYATKIIQNENKKITIKNQKDGYFIIILENHFAKIISENIFHKKYEDYEKWFIEQISLYIINTNYFLNSNIPTNSELKKVANILFREKEKYNIFLKNNLGKIIVKLNLKNNDNKILEFENYNNIFYNKNSFVEKIYDNNKTIWKLSLLLFKNSCQKIIKIFIKDDKKKFIVETKKIITEIKNNSINLSAKDFDDNAIGAFAHHIWNNFSDYYILVSNLGINQQLKIRLDIKNNEWYNKNFEIIGEKTELEKSPKELKETFSYNKNNDVKNCKIKSDSFLWGNVVEKSTSSWMKIKINKITWDKIFLLFFLVRKNDIFIKKLIELFKIFSPSYNDGYKLNEEEIKLFAYLIWENFSYYYDCFKKLENNELIRITWKTNYSTQKWSEESFEKYNEIVDKNNDVVDWQPFNDRKIKSATHKEKTWTSRNDEFKRKKRPNNNTITPRKKKLNWIIKEYNIGFVSNNSPESILNNLAFWNSSIDINQLIVRNISENSAVIFARDEAIDYYSNRYECIIVFFNIINPKHRQVNWVKKIQTTNIGAINSNILKRNEEILAKFALSNPAIDISQLCVVPESITDHSATIRTIRNPDEEYVIPAEITVNFTLFNSSCEENSRPFLRDIVHTRDLYFLLNNNPETILNRFINRNPGFVSSDLSVDMITNRSARIYARFDSESYQGYIMVNFILNSQGIEENLESIPGPSRRRNLNIPENVIIGALPDNNPETILNYFQESVIIQERFIDILQLRVVPESITEHSAIINTIENSNLYFTQSIRVNFSIISNVLEQKSKKNLRSIIPNSIINIPNNNPETIFEYLRIKYPELRTEELQIDYLDREIIRISPRQNSNYYILSENESIIVLISINENKDDQNHSKKYLDKDLHTNELGILTDNSPETILRILKYFNSALNTEELVIKIIDENHASVSTRSNSNRYFQSPEIIVSFDTPQTISRHRNRNNALLFQYSYSELRENDWTNRDIDLTGNIMSIEMEKQIMEAWCGFACLENILQNNRFRNNNSTPKQRQIANYFQNLRHNQNRNVDINGEYMFAIYKFIKNKLIDENSIWFNYGFLGLHNLFFSNFLTNKELKMLIFQYLVWFSLYLSTPVFLESTTGDIENMNHAMLIVGIEPNENPLKTLYLIRDPNTGKQKVYNGLYMYNIMFNELIYSSMLINKNILTNIFAPQLERLFSSVFFNSEFSQLFHQNLYSEWSSLGESSAHTNVERIINLFQECRTEVFSVFDFIDWLLGFIYD